MGRWIMVAAALASLGAGCGQASTPPNDAGGGSDAPLDAARADDTGTLADSGTDAASTTDTGTPTDAGHDAAAPVDAAHPDAGMCVDNAPDPHRPSATQCLACRPPSMTTTGTGACASDADCTDSTMGTNGRCVFGRIGTFCSYDQCFADGDCATDEVCLCDGDQGGANTCVPANCHVDADCGAGLGCSPTFGTCGHYSGFVAYRCHTATDECTVDSDCAAPGYCAFDEVTSHWACSTSECAG